MKKLLCFFINYLFLLYICFFGFSGANSQHLGCKAFQNENGAHRQGSLKDNFFNLPLSGPG
jgi:hypothetical protein